MNEKPQLVAIKARNENDAVDLSQSLTDMGFEADAFEHGGLWFARIIDLFGTSIEDALFEVSWHFERSDGTIPDTRHEAVSA